MENILIKFAATDAAEKADLFTSLGIDWKLLTLQIVAFLVLLAILRKWVYPPLVSMLDKREAAIKASAEAADKVQKAADQAEADVAALMQKARRDAAGIIANAKTEASTMISTAEDRSKKRADALVAAARSDIENEVKSARNQLYNETVDLVAMATERVIGKTMSDAVDGDLIKSSLKEAK